MNTDDLIKLLAANVEPVPAQQLVQRHALATVAGLAGAAVIMFPWLGVRAGLAVDTQLAMFWVKFGFVAFLLAGGLFAAARLSRPGASLEQVPAVIVLPLAAMWVLAVAVLMQAAPGESAKLVFGDTWKSCPINIAVLSLPAFAAAFWAMRGLAPTRLRLAGAAAGFAAGAAGALVYSLHCPELTAPFLGIWYVLGMLIPAAAGALLGPRLLRW